LPAVERPHLIEADGHLQREHVRAIAADLGAFHRVVVEKNEAVQAQLEVPRQRPQVARFALPVDAPRRQVLAPQYHGGVLVEHVEHILLAVLAAQAEQHPAFHLLDQELLEPAMGGRHVHPQRTVFPAHAVPQRIVAINCDHLVQRPFEAGERPKYGCADRGVALACVGDVGQVIAVRIVRILHGIARRQ
jgi:hypothetical protein